MVELRGLDVEVSLEVRSASEGGAEEWLMRMAIRGVLDTGWLPRRAGAEWSTASARLAIPSNARYEPMEIIVWSDAIGDGGRIHLRRIRIEPLGEA